MLSGLLLSLQVFAMAAGQSGGVPLTPSVTISADGRSLQFFIENDFEKPVICRSMSVLAHFVRPDSSPLGTINYQVLKQTLFPGEEKTIDADANTAAQALLAANPGARIASVTDPLSTCDEWTSITPSKPFWMSDNTFRVMKRYTTHDGIQAVMTPTSVMFNCDTRITSVDCPVIKKRALDRSCVTDEFNDYLRSVPNFTKYGVVPYCADYTDPTTHERFSYVAYFCPCDNP